MDFDVIIVGGGLAGASLAVALRSSRLKVAVVEARAPVRLAGWDARIYAISPANQRFLTDLGVWRHLDASRLTPVEGMKIFGDAGGTVSFSAYEAGLGELAWIAESSLVHGELWETLKRQHNVSLLCPARCAALSFEAGEATLTLEDGRRARARLMVAADGANSWVREQAGIQVQRSPYAERAVVGNLACKRGHGNIAFQWFREDGVLAYLPLPGQRISIVWSARDAVADELIRLDGAAFARRVAVASGGRLGELTLENVPAAFDLQMMRVAEVVRPRLALIGDAAHTIHPLSGHGINLGFQDARELASVLRDLPAWQDPGELSVLRRYARARAEEPLVMQYATDTLSRLFRHDNSLVSLVRNAGMNLTGAMPVLKSLLVRYATSGKL